MASCHPGRGWHACRRQSRRAVDLMYRPPSPILCMLTLVVCCTLPSPLPRSDLLLVSTQTFHVAMFTQFTTLRANQRMSVSCMTNSGVSYRMLGSWCPVTDRHIGRASGAGGLLEAPARLCPVDDLPHCMEQGNEANGGNYGCELWSAAVARCAPDTQALPASFFSNLQGRS